MVNLIISNYDKVKPNILEELRYDDFNLTLS